MGEKRDKESVRKGGEQVTEENRRVESKFVR